MEVKIIEYDFHICKVKDYSRVDLDSEYCFIGKTNEEKSLVCMTDFSLVGILAKISTLLSEGGIGIFAISTYNTDYVLTKKGNFEKAMEILSKAGYTIV